MATYSFIPGQWYKFYYTNGSTKVAKCITTFNGEIRFQVNGNGELSYTEMMRNCIKVEPIDKC